MTPTERETKMAQLLEVMREIRWQGKTHTHYCSDCGDWWSHSWARCGYPHVAKNAPRPSECNYPCPTHQWDDYPQSYGPEIPEGV